MSCYDFLNFVMSQRPVRLNIICCIFKLKLYSLSQIVQMLVLTLNFTWTMGTLIDRPSKDLWIFFLYVPPVFALMVSLDIKLVIRLRFIRVFKLKALRAVM